MAFKVTRDINDRPCRVLPVTSATYTVGQLLELQSAGTETAVWAACTSGSQNWTRKAIAMAAGTTVTTLLCQEIDSTCEVVALANAAALTADNGDCMLLTDSNTVNNAGAQNTSEEACFIQIGVADSTHIIGYVMTGTGIDPAAT